MVLKYALTLCFCCCLTYLAQASHLRYQHVLDRLGDTTIYLIAGQGGDERLFSKLNLQTHHQVKPITYFTPPKGLSMNMFARQLAQQIDTSGTYYIIGVSLGGMLATEMSSFLSPAQTILISSAKTRNELPFRYRFQKYLPIYKLVPAKLTWWGAKLLQPIVESDRNKEKETFKAMLADKDPKFIKRTIPMIMQWERLQAPDANLYHIHGTKDHTIPARRVKADTLLPNGSHMIVLTRAAEISELVNDELH